MNFRVLFMLVTLLLAACNDEAKKESEIDAPLPLASRGDGSSGDVDDVGGGTEDEVVDDVDGNEDDHSGDPDDADNGSPPSSTIPTEEDSSAYSEEFWLNFDCGENCESAKLTSDLENSSYAQIELPIKPLPLESVGVIEVSREAVESNIDTRYLANDIRAESLGNGMVKVTNNTPRKFISILVMHSTGSGSAPLKIEFDSTLSGFSSAIYSGVPEGTLNYVETAPILNLDISYRGKSESCDEPRAGDASWACVRHPTQQEEEILKALSANVKWFMNTYHLPGFLDAFAFGREYKGYIPKTLCTGFEGCESKFSVSEVMSRYLFTLASNGHRMNIGKLEIYNRGWVGLGGGRMPSSFWGEGRAGWISLAKVKTLFQGNYVTYMHELGHAMGFSHQSGFTYGFPGFAGKYVMDRLGDKQVVESVPSEVFLSKGWRDGNLYLKVYSSSESPGNSFKFQGLSMTSFDSVAYVSEEGSTVKVEFSEPPKQRFLVRVFSGESDLVMTRDIAPGILMLDKRSTDDLLVISDRVFNEILEKDNLMHSGIDRSPKTLEILCNKLFRKSDIDLIPTADALTLLSSDPNYYERFKDAPFYVRGGEKNTNPGIFDFESLIFSKVPDNEPLPVINLGCTNSI